MSITTTPPAVHTANITGSPGTTFAGIAAILAVVEHAMAGGMPTTQGGWIIMAGAIVSGIGGVLGR